MHLALILFAFIVGFTACLKEDNQYGILKVKVIDIPFPIDIIDTAEVTITKLETRFKSDSNDSEFIILSEDTVCFNLMELRNGITAELGNLELPAGDYDLFRLYVDKASLTLVNGETYDLKVPSGSQTGIKLFVEPAITVSGGLTSELLIDFNLEKSFVLKGNMNIPAGIKGFNFKPVIRAVNNSSPGVLAGVVSDLSQNPMENVSIRVYQDTLVASALSDENGYYAMHGLPEGNYTAAAVIASYDSLAIEDVAITAVNKTELDFELTPVFDNN